MSLISVPDGAAILGRKPRTIYKAVREGRMPHVIIAGKIVLDSNNLILADHRRKKTYDERSELLKPSIGNVPKVRG